MPLSFAQTAQQQSTAQHRTANNSSEWVWCTCGISWGQLKYTLAHVYYQGVQREHGGITQPRSQPARPSPFLGALILPRPAPSAPSVAGTATPPKPLTAWFCHPHKKIAATHSSRSPRFGSARGVTTTQGKQSKKPASQFETSTTRYHTKKCVRSRYVRNEHTRTKSYRGACYDIYIRTAYQVHDTYLYYRRPQLLSEASLGCDDQNMPSRCSSCLSPTNLY